MKRHKSRPCETYPYELMYLAFLRQTICFFADLEVILLNFIFFGQLLNQIILPQFENYCKFNRFNFRKIFNWKYYLVQKDLDLFITIVCLTTTNVDAVIFTYKPTLVVNSD